MMSTGGVRIGVDLDNTVACYDTVFGALAGRLGIPVPPGLSPKAALKHGLLAAGTREADWTRLQGEAYGEGMPGARPFDGVRATIERWVGQGQTVVLVSHRTRFPALGPPHDLHAAARAWVDRWLGDLGVPLFLEQTRWAKLQRIARERCDVFVDDLLEVLCEPAFPSGVGRVWFAQDGSAAPAATSPAVGIARSWDEVATLVSGHVAGREPRPTDAGRRNGRFDADPEPVFAELVHATLGTGLRSWTRLPGGINNLGARLELTDGRLVVGKIYRRDTNDPRDRLAHETAFLEVLERVGDTRVPRVLGVDPALGVALHTLVPGEPWPDGIPVPPAVWAQFQAFFEALQQPPVQQVAVHVPPAAESADSLQEHLAWVHARRDVWRTEALEGRLPNDDACLVLDELETEYQAVAAAAIGSACYRERVSREHLVLSPSDFGVHNALVTADGRVSFVDFEYAGWDDPAKADIDFSLQPRHRDGRPPGLSCLEGRLDRQSPRYRLLRRLLALKWRYIVLAARVGRAGQPPAAGLSPSRAGHPA